MLKIEGNITKHEEKGIDYTNKWGQQMVPIVLGSHVS